MESNNQTKKVEFNPNVQVCPIEKIGHRKQESTNNHLPLRNITKYHNLRWKYLPDKAGPSDQDLTMEDLKEMRKIQFSIQKCIDWKRKYNL